MEHRFEPRQGNPFHLVSGIFAFLAGVLYLILANSHLLVSCLFFLTSLLSFYNFWSYYKNGLLIIENNQIRYNYITLRSVKIISKSDIVNIEIQPKKFVINLNTGQNIKIHKGLFENKDIPKIESILQSFNR